MLLQAVQAVGGGLEEAGVGVSALEEAGIWTQGHSWSQRTFRQRGRGRTAASQVPEPQLPRLCQTLQGSSFLSGGGHWCRVPLRRDGVEGGWRLQSWS